jgi:hypothetical protein
MTDKNTKEALKRTRQEANKWTPEYRRELFKKGMAIIESSRKAEIRIKIEDALTKAKEKVRKFKK